MIVSQFCLSSESFEMARFLELWFIRGVMKRTAFVGPSSYCSKIIERDIAIIIISLTFLVNKTVSTWASYDSFCKKTISIWEHESYSSCETSGYWQVSRKFQVGLLTSLV